MFFFGGTNMNNKNEFKDENETIYFYVEGAR